MNQDLKSPDEHRRECAATVRAWIQHGPKLYCDSCGQRNDIDNMFFCISCASGFCWRCIDSMRKAPGKPGLVCRCGKDLEHIDHWIKLIGPELL